MEFNSAIGPYKGGLRFNPTVTLGMLKFLGFEQIFKNALTTLPMGGGKGGSDFDPKGKSNREVMAFCQSFHDRALRATSAPTPTSPPATSACWRPRGRLPLRPVQAPHATSGPASSPARASPSAARSPAPRPPATASSTSSTSTSRATGDSFEGKKVVVHGSGNVAIYAIQKVAQLGGTVVACSDTKGWVEDPEGIDYQVLEHIYNKKRSGHDAGA